MTHDVMAGDLEAALARAERLLKERFGHPGFLPGQIDALRSVLSQRSLLLVMPTGSGKSLLYQLPALIQEGLTVVVSPLIALMKDQVDDLTRKGVPATFVNSSLGLAEQRGRLQACAEGRVRLLYVAPERFRNAAFLDAIRGIKVARMAVDEAHCISQWGHDFRPDYLRLKTARERMGRPMVTALTATATARVQRDIVEALGLAPDEIDVHVHGFDRPNLKLQVWPAMDNNAKNDFLLRFLQDHPGAGIVYAGSRRRAEDVAAFLKSFEPAVGFYHAGMESEDRAAAQDRFLGGKDRVVVATNAFGMGIDKSDVRFVIHYNYPGSIEQYYQEIGRAGRDGQTSHCVLLYSPADRKLREFFIELNYPPRDVVEAVYQTLWSLPENPVLLTYKELGRLGDERVPEGQVGSAVRLLDGAGLTRAFSGEPKLAITLDRTGAEIIASARGAKQRLILEALSLAVDLDAPGRYEVGLDDLCRAAGLDEPQARRALLALADDGKIKYESPFRGRGVEKLAKTTVPFAQVPIDWDRQDKLRAAELDKLAAIERFITGPGCRRAAILVYFGEQAPDQCGACDRCVPPELDGDDVVGARPEIALPVLAGVASLRFSMGKSRIVQMVTGSRDKTIIEWRLDQNPAYGKVPAKPDEVKEVVNDLIRQGYLIQEGPGDRPILRLTDKGRETARGIDLAKLARPAARPSAPAKSKGADGATTGKISGPGRGATSPDEVQRWALRCVAELDKPLGLTKVAMILCGTKAKWIEAQGGDRLASLGAIAAKPDEVKIVLERMIKQGWFEKTGDKYPVLALTKEGQRRLAALGTEDRPERSEPAPKPPATNEDLEPEGLDPESSLGGDASDPARAYQEYAALWADDQPQPRTAPSPRPGPDRDLKRAAPDSRPRPAPAPDPKRAAADLARASRPQPPTPALSAAIDRSIRALLAAPPDDAKAMLPELAMIGPAELARRFAELFKTTTASVERARLTWAAGELCGLHGLDLIQQAAVAESSNLRLLAVQALAKILTRASSDSAAAPARLEAARSALQRLAADQLPSVSGMARRALEKL